MAWSERSSHHTLLRSSFQTTLHRSSRAGLKRAMLRWRDARSVARKAAALCMQRAAVSDLETKSAHFRAWVALMGVRQFVHKATASSFAAWKESALDNPEDPDSPALPARMLPVLAFAGWKLMPETARSRRRRRQLEEEWADGREERDGRVHRGTQQTGTETRSLQTEVIAQLSMRVPWRAWG